MAQSSVTSTTVRTSEQTSKDVHTIAGESSVQSLLDVLDDTDCRAILDGTHEEALTAKEVSEDYDIPLSTTYRKLDLLTEAGLLEERTRIRRGGRHASEYIRQVDDITISLGPPGDTEALLSEKRSEQTKAPASIVDG